MTTMISNVNNSNSNIKSNSTTCLCFTTKMGECRMGDRAESMGMSKLTWFLPFGTVE